MTDLVRVPGVGKVILTKRRFEHLLFEVNAQVRELAPAATDAAAREAVALDAIARDTAALLQAMSEVLPVLIEQQRHIDQLAQLVTTAAEAADAERKSRATPGSVPDAGSALRRDLLSAIDGADRQQAARLDTLREYLDATMGARAGILRFQRATVAPDASPPPQDVELMLCAYLAPLLPSPYALDVGAHRGRYSRALIDTGLTVAALEPNPELLAALEETIAPDGATVLPVAAGPSVGVTTLHVANDVTASGLFGDTSLFSTARARPDAPGLTFAAYGEVPMTTVDTVRTELGWPTDIGMLKIDVEGGETDVLDGLGATRPAVCMVEFWAPGYLLAFDPETAGVLPVVERFRQMGYRHWITIVHEDQAASFSVNNRTVPEGSWGNVLLFADRELFVEARQWCLASLPERLGAAVADAGS